MEVIGDQFKQGQSSMFRITVTNLGEFECIALPDFFLQPGFLGKEGWREECYWERGTKRDLPSWQNYYFMGPFASRGCIRYGVGRLLFDDYPSAPPMKEMQRKAIETACEKVELMPTQLDLLSLGRGEAYRKDVTVKIPDDALYADMGLYFDFEKLGYNGPLPFPIEVRDDEDGIGMRPIPRRPTNKAIAEDRAVFWQGFLYVFLKLPDLPKPQGSTLYLEKPARQKQ